MKLNLFALFCIGALTYAQPVRPAITTAIVGTGALIAARATQLFITRHDAVIKLVQTTEEVASYSVQIDTFVPNSKRKRHHGECIASKTVLGDDDYKVITEALDWISEHHAQNCIVIQPSVKLTNGTTYQLRKVRSQAAKHTKLEKELSEIFYAPEPFHKTRVQSVYETIITSPLLKPAILFFCMFLAFLVLLIVGLEIYDQIRPRKSRKK